MKTMITEKITGAYEEIVNRMIHFCEDQNQVFFDHGAFVKDPFWSTSQLRPTIVFANGEPV